MKIILMKLIVHHRFKISRNVVLESLKRLDVSKSTNGFGNRFLRECADVTEPTITKLFKLTTKKASFVSNWKIQRVSPVHKRGPKSVPSKYRPVSVIDNLTRLRPETSAPSQLRVTQRTATRHGAPSGSHRRRTTTEERR
jgi:hypothetical protein